MAPATPGSARGHSSLRAAPARRGGREDARADHRGVLERLRAAPSEPISIERIAEMAGVARSTVYAIFGSRAGLFDAVGTDLHERTGHRRLVAASHQADARVSLRAGIQAASEMLARDRDIRRALHSMAQLEEAVGGAIQGWEEERAAAMARIARGLEEQGVLRPSVGAEEAANVLWVLTSFESFDLLYTGRGLAVDAVVDVLMSTAERSLFAA